jgi:sugar phosphate isomerase/epimerase
MKLGVSSYSFRKYILSEKCDYLKICDLAKEIGFDGIEFINLDENEFGITTDCLATAKEIKAHCDKIGLEIIAYTVSANLLADDIDGMIKYLFDCVDVTEALGAKVMRHDVCSVLPKKPLYNYRDAIEDMVPHIRRVTEYAASKGIRTCTENHGKIFQAPERVEELIRAVIYPFAEFCEKGADLTVVCSEKSLPEVKGPCIFFGKAPERLSDMQRISGILPMK